MPEQPANDNYDLADDILRGAQEIADFLIKSKGGQNRASRRPIYHLVKTSRLPTFREGGRICARKSVLLEFIRRQEDRSVSEWRKQA